MNKLIKIYGERNTNTNYLRQLIDLNLEVAQIPGSVPTRVARWQEELLPGDEWLKDLYFYLTYPRNLGWKHSMVRPAKTLQKTAVARANDVAIVTISKNPYSWLLSLFRNPYSQRGPRKSDFESFLSAPWKTTCRDNTPGTLRSPIALWNLKNASYLQLSSMQVMNLKTEDMFIDASGVIAAISERFVIPRKCGDFIDYPQSTKRDGQSGEWYRDYYVNEKWRGELSGEAIAIINRAVDREVMAHFGYEVMPGK